MSLYQRNRSGLGISLLALGLAMSVAGVANAENTGAKADLKIVDGSLSGTGDNGFQALLDFSVPGGGFDGAADKLAGAQAVDFNSSFTGQVKGLGFDLDATKAFDPGSAANFVRGDSGEVRFDNASFATPINGELNIGDPRAQVLNPTFTSDDHKLSNLTGGTFKLNGTNPTPATLGLEASGAKGGGTFTAAPSNETPAGSDNIQVGLTGINGHITSGDNAPDGQKLAASLNFDISRGALGRIDLNDLEDMNGNFTDTGDGIRLLLTLDGELEGVSNAGDVPGELSTTVYFRTPEDVANLFLGESQGIGHTSFLTLNLPDELDNGFSFPELATASLSDPIFDGDENSLSTLAGGTLNLEAAGDTGMLGRLNLDNDFVADNASALFLLDPVLGAGDGPFPPSATVPAPSGYAMLLFLGLGVAGMGFIRRARNA